MLQCNDRNVWNNWNWRFASESVHMQRLLFPNICTHEKLLISPSSYMITPNIKTSATTIAFVCKACNFQKNCTNYNIYAAEQRGNVIATRYVFEQGNSAGHRWGSYNVTPDHLAEFWGAPLLREGNDRVEKKREQICPNGENPLKYILPRTALFA